MIDTQQDKRWQIFLQGSVQGVGFRPFVYRLALDIALSGFVCNTSHGVTIEIEGNDDRLNTFIKRLRTECPAHAAVSDMRIVQIPLQKDENFVIRDSRVMMRPEAFIPPDLCICSDCLKEILDPADRRYNYPFTNCTHCGPRYTIIETLPYDRDNTSMKRFKMCSNCQDEYNDPLNRRFHAQPNACPQCGPQLTLVDPLGKDIAAGQEALTKAVEAIRSGRVLALKGLGGFQLMVNACDDNAVKTLRERKGRAEKPFALMFPDDEMIKAHCHATKFDLQALQSAQAPIVLIARKKSVRTIISIARSVSLSSPSYGVMLPYTPLHVLLMKDLGVPVVATSANLSEEPMSIDNTEALQKLGKIADVFLMHDRPIVRPVDDSVGMVIKDRFSVLRRARGYAPLPVVVHDHHNNILALGSQMKNTVALKLKNKVYLSQHIGDLQSEGSMTSFHQSITSLKGLYPHAVDYVAVDQHPDYASTRFGLTCKEPLITIQHHHAHIAACMAENQLNKEVLGIAWDGTGYGEDHTIWGGEILLSTLTDFKRVGHLLPFRLPGGEMAIHHPKRIALSLLYMVSDGNLDIVKDLKLVQAFTSNELMNIQKMVEKGFQSPICSSMGRLFDGISALLGFCDHSTYEGQAAIELENGMKGLTDDSYRKIILDNNILDWRPMLKEIINDLRKGVDVGCIADKFHNTIVEMAVGVAHKMGHKQVVLSGGCFQNRYLITRMIDRLRQEGFDPYWHSVVPTNDGGIALGQAVIASARCHGGKGK